MVEREVRWRERGRVEGVREIWVGKDEMEKERKEA